MSKNKGIQFLKIAIIVFQLIFIFQLTFAYDIFMAANPFTNRITEESYLWYVQNMENVSNEMLLLGIAGLSKILFQITFLLGIIYFLTKPEFRSLLGKKKIWFHIALSMVLYTLAFWIVEASGAHYRLYMNSISVEVLSLLLGAYIWESQGAE